VGLMGMKAPAREGAEIFDAAGEKKIGEVTSGTYSPCLKGNYTFLVHTYVSYVLCRR
jgi:glycine cleavage system aminomethyltransferase T